MPASQRPASNQKGQPMTFKIPASKRSIDQNRFPFEDDKGKQHSIPLLKFLPVAAAELMEDGKNVAALLVACDNDGTRDVIRSWDGEQFQAFMDEWTRLSGVESGESQGSADS